MVPDFALNKSERHPKTKIPLFSMVGTKKAEGIVHIRRKLQISFVILVPCLFSRLVEYFEYQKIAGISRIVLAELDEKVYNFTLARDSKKVLDYYKELGFLESYDTSFPDNFTNPYKQGARTKPAQYSYCMIKYGLISDYVIVQDMDEIVGFNSHIYKNIPEAILAREDKNKSFFLTDQPMARRCKYAIDIPKASRFELLRTQLFYQNSFNFGKTIHSSQACQIAWHHQCILPRTDSLFSGALKNQTKLPSSRYIGLKSPNGKNVMRSLHFREEMHNSENASENINVVCGEDRVLKLDWLVNLSKEILENSLKVLGEIGIKT